MGICSTPKVGGNWVPITVSSTVTPPAQAGPRSDYKHDVRFGHLAQRGTNGLFASFAGNMYAIVGGTPAPFNIFGPAPTNTRFASIRDTFSILNGWAMGIHPNHGLYGFWRRDSEAGVGQYRLLSASGTTIVNGEGSVELRVANSVRSLAGAVDSFTYNHSYLEGAVRCRYIPTNRVWNTASLQVSPQGGDRAVIAFNAPGVAPQFCERVGPRGIRARRRPVGPRDYAPLRASSFIVSSALKTKRAVRPLRVVPEQITTYHDPMLNCVPPEPDVMALRPVAFRPHVPAYVINDDGDSVERDPATWLGHEGVRERLGLIADEVQYVIPSAVAHNDQGEWAASTTPRSPLPCSTTCSG